MRSQGGSRYIFQGESMPEIECMHYTSSKVVSSYTYREKIEVDRYKS